MKVGGATGIVLLQMQRMFWRKSQENSGFMEIMEINKLNNDKIMTNHCLQKLNRVFASRRKLLWQASTDTSLTLCPLKATRRPQERSSSIQYKTSQDYNGLAMTSWSVSSKQLFWYLTTIFRSRCGLKQNSSDNAGEILGESSVMIAIIQLRGLSWGGRNPGMVSYEPDHGLHKVTPASPRLVHGLHI